MENKMKKNGYVQYVDTFTKATSLLQNVRNVKRLLISSVSNKPGLLPGQMNM